MGHIPKTDELDGRVMARIGYLHEAVGEEFTLKTMRLADPQDADLLALCRDNWRLTTMLIACPLGTRIRNQFSQLMAVVFPELKTFFTRSVSSVAPVQLMAAFPTPAEIAAAEPQAVKDVLWQAGAYHHARRVIELQELARKSSGLLPDPQRAWRLAWATKFLLTNFEARADLRQQIVTLVTQRDDYPLLADLPYAKPATIGTILAATGDIDRFSNYRQYVAYTGYFAGLVRSQTIDRTRMSTRGNRDLKRTVFQITAPLVWFDKGENKYKTLFERKQAEGRPWYKAMPYPCAALARHIFHCLKHRDPYDAEKAFGVPALIAAESQELADLEADLDERFEVMEAHLELEIE